MKNHISIDKAAKYLVVSINTLRVWEKKKILVPERTPTGYRRYKISQVDKRLLDGRKVQDIRITVQGKFRLNSRQANDAVYDVQTTTKSQYELVQMHYENAKAKVEFREKRITKAKSPAKIAELQKQLEKEQRKLAFCQKHLDNNTFPPVVFGGKKLFQERCKGNITKEEWQEVRSNRYLSRGDKTKGGNLNTRIYEDQDQILS
jgi:DNA-binding transcriptional MerR regulator